MNLPLGYKYAATYAGIRAAASDDVALIVSGMPANAAGVFTQNRVQAAPVRLARRHLSASKGLAGAILVNAGNANCATRTGDAVALSTCKAAAKLLKLPVTQVLPASTGVIGVELDPRKITDALPRIVESLAADRFDQTARAIMTTDLVPKTAHGEVKLRRGTVRISGMTKGSGMIHPLMATTLGFVLTDANIPGAVLRPMLRRCVELSYNRLSVDGDTSTNDTLLLLANGASGVRPDPKEFALVEQEIARVMESLAQQIARDGEGAKKFVTIDVSGAPNAADRAILVAQIGSPAAGRFQNRLPFPSFSKSSSVAQSLRPFPQFGSLNSSGPLGRTWYDSLQARATKRLSHGLEVTYNFTWSKELDLGVENDTGLVLGQAVNDIFNRQINKQLSSFSRPFWQVIAVNYTSPKWGPNRIVKAAISDWTVGSVLQYGSGQPIATPNTATSNLSTALLRGTRAQRVPGQPLFTTNWKDYEGKVHTDPIDLNCHCFDPATTQVLNPAAWTDPAGGAFSSSALYYDDYRFQRRPKETFSVGRVFRITERAQFQIRAEFTNIFNRTQTPNPSNGTNFTSPLTKDATRPGNNTGGFGSIYVSPTNAVIGERSGLLVGRFTF